MKGKHFKGLHPMLLTSCLILVWKVGWKQYITIDFEKKNVNEQTHDASTIHVINVTECYCKIGSEFYPEDRMNIKYGTNN